MEVLGVFLQMVGEELDAFRDECNLHFAGARIGPVFLMLLNNRLFLALAKHNAVILLQCSWIVKHNGFFFLSAKISAHTHSPRVFFEINGIV